MARVFATAFHAPEKLDELLKPTITESAYTAAQDPDAWEQDQWWKEQS
jgi:hypothetical protein